MGIITRSTKRVAEVWLDEYKQQYYNRVPSAKLVRLLLKFVDSWALQIQTI